jgi:nitroreductase
MSRIAEHPIEPFFVERWSSRAMTGESVSETDLLRLFEAARWAPSAMNAQPWRFLYARAGNAHFPAFLSVLVEANRSWCVRAGALVAVLSKTHFDNGQPSPSHLFDAGAAWMSLALQGSRMGLVVHAMGGFDAAAARAQLGVPADYAIACFVAVGHPGATELLSASQQAREVKSPRRPVQDFASEGPFAPDLAK